MEPNLAQRFKVEMVLLTGHVTFHGMFAKSGIISGIGGGFVNITLQKHIFNANQLFSLIVSHLQ